MIRLRTPLSVRQSADPAGRLLPGQVVLLAVLTVFVALATLMAPTRAQASDYLIEAIVFRWNAGPQGEEVFDLAEKTLPAPSAPGIPSGSQVQQNQPSLLVDEAARLRRAGVIDVLEHLSWTQSRAPQRGSPKIDLGGAPGSDITGWIRLYNNTYLFAELDLAVSGASAQPHRMKTRRRVKFNEVHYFDHPGMGVLVQISKNQ